MISRILYALANNNMNIDHKNTNIIGIQDAFKSFYIYLHHTPWLCAAIAVVIIVNIVLIAKGHEICFLIYLCLC